MTIIEKCRGTKLYDTLTEIETLYADIDKWQASWKEKTPAPCPDGCGHCCENFEPEVYEAEALYLAAWLIEHQQARAHSLSLWTEKSIRTAGCFLFDPHNAYHCTVYGRRCLICRLFAYSGVRGKDARLKWKPCKFIPTGETALVNWQHREYDEAELYQHFKTLPPDMANASVRLLALHPEDTVPRPLREALPSAIKKIKLILYFLSPPTSPNPDMPSPSPLSA